MVKNNCFSLSDSIWKGTLCDDLDRHLLSPTRTSILTAFQGPIQCRQGGRLRIARNVSFRTAKKTNLEIQNGTLSVGFQPKGGRRYAAYDHSSFVIHPGGSLIISGDVEFCAGSCVGIGPNGNCEIGPNVLISPNSFLISRNQLSIGEGCKFSWNVTVMDDDLHKIIYQSSLDPSPKNFSTRIGKRVLVGHHVTILKGITIGDDAVIGANSVVTHDIPEGCMAVGNPARVIKKGVEWKW